MNTTFNSDENLAQLSDLARALMGRALGFRDCTAALLDTLVNGAAIRRVDRGQFVVRRGDKFQHVYMVVQGVLESSMLRSDGDRHLTGLLLPGDFSGLIGLADPLPCSHDVVARESSVLAVLPKEQMLALRAANPTLVLACERQIAMRMRLSFERLGAGTGMPLEVRLAGMLHMLSRLYGRAQGTSVVFDVKLSQSDLADWLGISRQRINFALRQFADEGLIELNYSRLVIHQSDELARRAAQ